MCEQGEVPIGKLLNPVKVCFGDCRRLLYFDDVKKSFIYVLFCIHGINGLINQFFVVWRLVTFHTDPSWCHIKGFCPKDVAIWAFITNLIWRKKNFHVILLRAGCHIMRWWLNLAALYQNETVQMAWAHQ